MSLQARWRPVRRSPVHHKLVELGAVLEVVSGWSVVEHFGDPVKEEVGVRSGVGLADLSLCPKWEVKGTDMTHLPRLVPGQGVPEVPSPGNAVQTESGYLCRVSPNHALWILQKDSVLPTVLSINVASRCLHLTDRTFGLGCFLVCGTKARAVLQKLTALDLRETKFPNSACASVPLAAIQVLVVRKDRSDLFGYEILFSREYGEYLWTAVMEAGSEFGMYALGLAAVRSLES